MKIETNSYLNISAIYFSICNFESMELRSSSQAYVTVYLLFVDL